MSTSGLRATGRIPVSHFARAVASSVLVFAAYFLVMRSPDILNPYANGQRHRHSTLLYAEGDHYHSIANPAKGEPVGERGLPNPGYRPGRKTARRQDKQRKRRGGGSGPRP
jgi:hypothetical protein